MSTYNNSGVYGGGSGGGGSAGPDFSSNRADEANVNAFNFETDNTLTQGNLLNVLNNGVSAFSIDYEGGVQMGAPNQVVRMTFGRGPSYLETSSAGLKHDGGTFQIGDTVIKNRYGGGIEIDTSDTGTDIDYQLFFQPASTATRGITNFTVKGADAHPDAATKIVGGNLTIEMGDGAANSSGAANGGDITLNMPDGFGTGRDGLLILGTNFPTTDPLVAGAVWDDAGTLKRSAG